MKLYQLDIFGNEVSIDKIIWCEKLDKKDRSKKDHRYIFQRCCLKKLGDKNVTCKKSEKTN